MRYRDSNIYTGNILCSNWYHDISFDGETLCANEIFIVLQPIFEGINKFFYLKSLKNNKIIKLDDTKCKIYLNKL